MPPLLRKARGLAAITGAISAGIWLLWLADSALIERLNVGGPSMKPNTAASIFFVALALWMVASQRTRFLFAPVALAGLLNGLTVLEYATGVELGIDRTFAHGHVTDAAPIGRTSLSAAIAFLALSAAFVALQRRKPVAADLLAMLAGAIGLFASVMHLFGDPVLRTNAAFTVAIQTALCILMLAAGVLAVNQGGRVLELITSPSAGGSLARRLVPLSIFLPLLFAWIRYVSMEEGWLHGALGLELFAIFFVVILAAFTWWAASSLDRSDTARAAAAEAREVALKSAEDANRAKDEFLAMLGHELRNPLAPIFAALDRMKDLDRGVFTRERAILERQAHHMERLVSDLMDVSRIARNALVLDRSPIPLGTVVDVALETVAHRVEKQGLILSTESSAADLWVDGDRSRLVQLVVNLLVNSCNHTPRGGKIAIHLAREGKQAVLSVADNGSGIDPELLPRVFDNFVQASQNIERQRGGLGLGLAIVRNLAQLHGGSASIESPGKNLGTVATVRLPEIAAPARLSKTSDPGARAKLPVHPGSSVRVLVVDDNEDAVEMLALLLSDSGYVLEKAYDGEQALRLAREFAPHLILLDLGLPKLSGFEVARRLRADPLRRGVRIVAVTGFGQPRDRQRATEAGIDQLVVKPLEFAQLRTLMSSLLATSPLLH